MNRDEALRLRGRCTAWGCKEPVFADYLCSEHQVAHSLDPKAPGPEPVRAMPVHRAKRTRRFSLGRTTVGPTQSNPQRSTYSARRADSTLPYSDNGTAASSSLPRQFPMREGSNNTMPPYPASPVPNMSRQNQAATAGFLGANASTITVGTAPSEPREPYFELNTDIPSPNGNRLAPMRQNYHQNAPENRHVPSNTVPRRALSLIGELVEVDAEFRSNVKSSVAQSSISSSHHQSSTINVKIPPPATTIPRPKEANSEESRSITVAPTPGWRRPDSTSANRHEASTIHVYQNPMQSSFQVKENIPLHIPPKKRKAESPDTLPKIKQPSVVEPRPDGRSAPSELKRQAGPRNAIQPEHGHQNASLSKPPKSYKPSDEQTTNRPRNPKKVRPPDTLTPAVDAILAKANGQLENHIHARIEVLGDGGKQKEAHASSQPRQPKPQANGSSGGLTSIMNAPLSPIEKDTSAADETIAAETIVVATEAPPKEQSKASVPSFDSEAFDTMIYRQSALRPPRGVTVQAPARPKTPVQKPSVEDRRQYLHINPAIHYPYIRSEKWDKEKALEIQARGGRKAWFGKVIERRRWLRAKEKAEEDARNAARRAKRRPARIDPQPWSYNRAMDFGDVPEEELPDDVLQNPAWLKACAWHRENHAKRVLRERATKDASREAWDLAERVMENAKMASKKSREPSKH